VFIQSFEQSNLKQLNRMTNVRLMQLVDANDVNPDGSLDYTAPFDRPYDWTVSGDPVLQARTFGFFATDAGLRDIKTYADGIGPWKRYIVSTAAVDLNGDGTVADENGDGAINDADRKGCRPPR
jgi:glycerophosphoryl diester phosphodiesterase